MSKIKILPENLANQIAAGEVVERPASVVKELVENSLDSGASLVDIEVQGNGTRLIRVIDDGRGMDHDDVLLCLERHGTSKLKTLADLGAIQTLGFRGEALPSIGSVAKLFITSRVADSPLGMRAEVRFGKLMRAHEMGCPQGTVVEVRDLFGNVPARRKFLKSAATEIFHMEEVVIGYGLVHPELGLRFSVNGKDVIDLPAGSDTIEDRIRRLSPKGISGPLIILSNSKVDPGAQVTGCLLPPDSNYGASTRLRLFVNGRVVRDRMLSHAVAEGMRNFLLKGRRPAGVIFLTLPPDEVDVNVHPTKQEIRFHKSPQIHSRVVEAVQAGMLKYQNSLRENIFVHKEKNKPARQAVAVVPAKVERQGGLFKKHSLEEPSSFNSYENVNLAESDSPVSLSDISPADQSQKLDVQSFCGLEDEGFQNVRIIGQVMNAYIICEVEDGLVAIDQHAVQERILFEKLKKDYQQQGVPRQTLLFPKMVQFDPIVSSILQKNTEEILKLGVEIEPFGGDSYVIKAVPALMTHLEAEDIVLGILSRFTEKAVGANGTRLEHILASMACKAAIKAGQNLSLEEMEHLAARILQSPVFSHCPHGRPVLKQFSARDIKGWFHRT